MFARWKASDTPQNSTEEEQPKPTPPSSFILRTKSLRERFGSKRSQSENFAPREGGPTCPVSSPTRVEPRTVRPSLPIIGVPEVEEQDQKNQPQSELAKKQQQQKQSKLGGADPAYGVCPFVALPEETYCSALDINSQEGEPRFPWQRDAAVQCQLSPEGCRYARKDSFFMIAQERKKSSAQIPEADLDKIKEVYWRNLSICTEDDEDEVLVKDSAGRRRKSTALQRAYSERTRTRRLVHQQSVDHERPLERSPLPERKQRNQQQSLTVAVTNSPGPKTDTPTPPSGGGSPQTPPSRRNSDRRRRAFVRKNTRSAPDSFEKEESQEDPVGPEQRTRPYFDFDSVQRLLDMSVAGRPDKPTLLLPPGGLGKDKGYMTLPSPNVQTAEEQDVSRSSKRFSSSQEDEEDESELDDTPPASALHRRRALVPPKSMTYDYESTTDDGGPSETSPTSGSKGEGGRKDSVVVIPPMQICPGDLLVYGKVGIPQRPTLDYGGSTQNLTTAEDSSSRKAKSTWSILRIFERRTKSEAVGGLEEVLSNLRPSEFMDDHLAKYKGMMWSEFVAVMETKKGLRGLHRKNSKRQKATTSQNNNVISNQSNLVDSFNDAQAFTESNSGYCSGLDELGQRIESLDVRNEQRRREGLWDLFQSECLFLYDHLLVLKNVFMEPLKKIQVEGFAMFAEPEVLFGNLDELCCI